MGITISIKQLLKKRKKNGIYGLILCLANFVIKFQNTYSINALAHFIIFFFFNMYTYRYIRNYNQRVLINEVCELSALFMQV